MKSKCICACNKCFGLYYWYNKKICYFRYYEENKNKKIVYVSYIKKYGNSNKAIEIQFSLTKNKILIIEHDTNNFKKNFLYEFEIEEVTFEYIEDYANKVINNLMFV